MRRYHSRKITIFNIKLTKDEVSNVICYLSQGYMDEENKNNGDIIVSVDIRKGRSEEGALVQMHK